MTRGRPPVVAIAEAMHYAERTGYQVIEVQALWLPCDFMAISEGRITLVRVRRLRYGRYGLPDIVASCTREILELRSTPVGEKSVLGIRYKNRSSGKFLKGITTSDNTPQPSQLPPGPPSPSHQLPRGYRS